MKQTERPGVSLVRGASCLVFVLAASCGSSLTADPAPRNAAPLAQPTIVVASPSPIVLTPGAPGGMCSATLAIEAAAISSQTCRIDARVLGHPGSLRYPCGGGPARAMFDHAEFAGEVSATGLVTLALTTQFPFTDGCTWQSVQHLAGSLAGRRMDYRYDEAPLPGQAGCDPACEATAVFDVR